MNEWIKSPIALLLLAGILALLAAITKGGLNIGPVKIPKLKKGQCWLVGSIGTIFIIIGLIALFKIPQTPDPGKTININNNPVSQNINDTSSQSTQKPVKKTASVKGVLTDIFSNILKDENISLQGDSVNTNSITNNKGQFSFTGLQNKKLYTLTFKDTVKKVLASMNNTERINLTYNPLQKIHITLCKNIDKSNKAPIGKFERENPIIHVDSLPVDDATELHTISCFMRLYGEYAYTLQNDIVFSFYWTTNDETYTHSQDIAFSESGWRTWITKKIWKGNWKLEIKTKTGYVIEKFIFKVI